MPLLKCRMPPTIFDDSKQMMRMQSMHQFLCPSVLYGWTRAADRHCASFAFVARVEFHVDFVLEQTITPDRLKARQKMSRDGYTAVTRRAKIARRQIKLNWLRIGTALAPEHSKRLGVTNQTQGNRGKHSTMHMAPSHHAYNKGRQT
jgi:hypothetical protein